MAGEYSRELSSKVFAGQCRLIERGFRQGGLAGFGLRRMLLDEQGNEKGVLRIGEHKSLQTDRVVLVPGPPDEVLTVREIYKQFVDEAKSETEIADRLNKAGQRTDLGRAWTRGTVHQVLTNEKYIGHNVFNRTSFKLKQRHVSNPKDMWVRANNAFEPVVPVETFHIAQGIIRERSRKFTEHEMLEQLKQLYERYGYISGLIIDEAPNLASSSAYSHRFGSLLRAYSLVGFEPDRDFRYIEINRALRAFHAVTVSEVIQSVETLGAKVDVDASTQLLTINSEFTAAISVARHYKNSAGRSRWKIRFDVKLKPVITIGIRMNEANDRPLDYYLLPSIDFQRPLIELATQNRLNFEIYRFQSLDPLFKMAKRTPIREVA